MQWFKHDSNANADDKLQEVLLDYGLEGYGLYWYCIELIVGRIDKNNITFELKHDARIIARNVGSTPQKVQEMMRRFIDLGLFEESNGHITCLKIARRLDSSMTGNAYMREIIAKIKSHDGIMTESCGSHDKSESNHDDNSNNHDAIMLDKKERKDKTRQDKIENIHAENVHVVFDCWRNTMGHKRAVLDSNRKTLITNRLKTYSVDDLCKAISGCSKSAWHMGSNDRGVKHDGLDLILRNAEYIEKFMSYDDAPPVNGARNNGAGLTKAQQVEQANREAGRAFVNEINGGGNVIEGEACHA